MGTPVLTVVKSGDGNQRAGLYRLSFTSVVPGVSATCVVNTDDPHDPSRNLAGVAVTLNGTTTHDNVIKGLRLVFSSSGSFNATWTATVFYGAYFDTTDSTEQSITRVGTVEAGQSSTTQRLAVRNDGADLAASCDVRVVNGAYFVNTAGTPIKLIRHTELQQTANFSPGYAITFVNLVAGVSIDIRVDGLTRDVKRIDTGVVFPGGAALPLNDTIVFEWTTGPLTGLRFSINTSANNSSTATIFVSDSARLVKIAPDVSGSPGTFQDGTTSLQLTQSGGSQPGEIAAGQVGFFHAKVQTQAADSPTGNQRHHRFILRGLSL